MQRLHKHRGILTAITLLALVSAGVVGYQVLYRLPAPADCTRGQLLRWLALRDLSVEPRDTQVSLVDRLVDELLAPGGSPATAGGANWLIGDQLQRNTAVLKQVWFTSRVERYHDLDSPVRAAWLDQQVETVQAWTAMERSLRPSNTESSSGATAFFADIANWIRQADSDESARMQSAVNAALVRWLATRDLSEQSLATRQALAERIAVELDRGLEPGKIGAAMPKPEAARLRSNGMLLMEAWLTSQATLYQSLAPAEQGGYLDRTIDRVQHWGIDRWLAAESPAGSANLLSGPLAQLQLMATVNSWVERASAEDQPALRELVEAVQQRMLARLLSTPES